MVPKSVTKIKTRKGQSYVEFTESVDFINYTMDELIRAALRDVGKYIVKITKKKIKKQTGRLEKNTQYWVRKKSCDLQVGFKPGGFYGMFQEFGTEKTPKIGALTSSVQENIDTIRNIEAQYLSALSSESRASGLIGKDGGSSEE